MLLTKHYQAGRVKKDRTDEECTQNDKNLKGLLLGDLSVHERIILKAGVRNVRCAHGKWSQLA